MRRVLTALAALAVIAVLPVVTTTSADAAPDPAPNPLGQVTFTGVTQVGRTLTAHTAGWPVTGTSTFTWQNTEQSATGQTYVLPAKASRYPVQLTETFSSPGHEDATATTTITPISKGDAVQATAPTTMGGVVAVGQKVAAVRASWSIYGESTYTWSVGGAVVGTGPSYVPTSSDLGKPLTLTELLTPLDYELSTSSSVVTVRPGLPQTPTVRPRVDGTVRVGSTLTVASGTWPLAGSSSFVWAADGKTVATGPSYEVAPSVSHQKLTLTEILSVPGYDPSPTTIRLGLVERVPVALSVSVRKARKGKKAVVTALSTNTRLTLPDEVTLTYAGKKVAAPKLKDGKLTVKLPSKPRGKYWLTVSYPGTAAFARARTAIVVKVR